MTDQEKKALLVRLVENVLGGKRIYAHEGMRTAIYTYELPSGDEIRLGFGTALDGWDATENIADAWMLVEALHKSKPEWVFHVESEANHFPDCCILDESKGSRVVSRKAGETAAEAICHAADKATREAV